MTNFQDFLAEQLKDDEVKAEYDALEPEFSIIQAIIDARKSAGLTQKQLSERTGIAQSDISKLEGGNANPSLKTLRRLANGMGMQLKLEFVPIAHSSQNQKCRKPRWKFQRGCFSNPRRHRPQQH